jgi:ADP-ribosyl-[dinitrogen reductase] hydrolase
MLGAIIGDIVGSVYEFNNFRAKNFEPFFHAESFFTDDSVCTAAVAESLTQHVDPAVSLRKWGRRYWENGGWGMRFAEWLGSDDEGPYNSFGNGAGMRVSPAGFLARTLEEAIQLSDRVTEVTHNHPEGMKGAAATAAAIFFARSGLTASEIRQEIVSLFGYDLSQSVDQIRPGYRYNERSQDTVPQALTCALEATSFEDAIRNSISIGGDSDTIAAIAGGVAEALFGIPESMARIAWDKLPEDIQAAMTDLYATAEHRSKHPDPPRITVVEGSILDQLDCDGLVNSANENLRAGSGVCGVIHSAAGPELEAHSHKLSPLALGAAIATPGFRLPQRTVIHTRGPKYLFDPEPAKHLAEAMTNTLRVADQEQLARIAVPAISMGVYAYPHSEAVPILVKAAKLALPRLHYLQEIRFTALSADMTNLFRTAIASVENGLPTA